MSNSGIGKNEKNHRREKTKTNRWSNIWNLYKLDWARMFKNPIAIAILIALIILPSLYAWFNIAALWDPYGNTGDLKVAVYSDDRTVSVADEETNVGKELVQNLRGNDSLDWQFVKSREELQHGVISGTYYAGIYIPENFSENLIGFIKGDLVNPEIDYRVNEKINAISPKITSSGVNTLQSEITANFTKVISEILLKKANELGIDIEKTVPLISKIEQQILDVNNNWDKWDDYRNKLKELEGKLPEIQSKLDTASKIPETFDEVNLAGEKIVELNRKFPAVEEYAKTAKEMKKNLPSLVEFSDKIDQFDKAGDDLESILSDVTTKTDVILSLISEVRKTLPNDNANKEIDKKLEELSQKISEKNNKLKEFETSIPEIKSELHRTNEQIKSRLKDAEDALDTAEELYDTKYTEIKEKLQKLANFIENDLPGVETTVQNTINTANDKFPDIRDAVITINDQLDQNYGTIKEGVQKAAKLIQSTEDTDTLKNIIRLLGLNADAESDFISSPIKVKEIREYPIPNYGSASTPFYTVLALWVGSLLLLSIAGTKFYLSKAEKEKYSQRQQHIARLLTMLTIAFFQALVVSLGNIFMLKVYIVEPIWFTLGSIFIGIVFMSILYTLVALFGNFGKGVGVIILVLSISGGGGNFPVELSGEFFRIINPLLPFTYAVNLLRETLGGIYPPSLIKPLIVLSAVLIIVIPLGTIFEPTITKVTHKVDKKLSESHFFH